MFTPDSALAGELRRQCTPGYGELASTPHCPEIAQIAAGIGPVATNEVFLTPPSDAICNPLLRPPEIHEIYRGPRDHRSFSVTGRNRTQSLTVKGGDLPHMTQLPSPLILTKLRRIGSRQIPGAGLLSECQREFEAAQNLQEWSLEAQGRLTHTAVPLRVSSLTSVTNKYGELVSTRDFMDSDEYLQPKESERILMRTSSAHSLKLGTLLLDTFGLEPAVYMYATEGVNVRLESLYRARYFANGDNLRARGVFVRAQKALNDPLHSFSFASDGERIPVFAGRKDSVFRTIYQLLGDAYGFDAKEILPEDPITDRNYMRWLTHIPYRCQEEGVTDLVLLPFIDRITEVAALAHAHGFVLGGNQEMGSALHARNVTLEGVVLDLDSMRPFASLWQDYILKDFNSLLATVAKLERMVSGTFPPTLVDTVYESYLSKLEAFGQNNKKVMHAIADVVRQSSNDAQTDFELYRMRYDQPRL